MRLSLLRKERDWEGSLEAVDGGQEKADVIIMLHLPSLKNVQGFFMVYLEIHDMKYFLDRSKCRVENSYLGFQLGHPGF